MRVGVCGLASLFFSSLLPCDLGGGRARKGQERKVAPPGNRVGVIHAKKTGWPFGTMDGATVGECGFRESYSSSYYCDAEQYQMLPFVLNGRSNSRIIAIHEQSSYILEGETGDHV